jgi:hypothetical protein
MQMLENRSSGQAQTRSADRVEHGLTAPAGADPLDNQDGIYIIRILS